MASNTSYIGPGQTYVDLSTWETAVEDDSEVGNDDQIAILKADIVDNVTFSGWGGAGDPNVIIKGDLTGNIKRKITSAPGGAHIMHPTSGGMSILTLQDLLIDCGPQASGKSGIYCSTGFATLTMERVTIKDAVSIGLYITNASSYLTGTIDNCIFDGNRYAIGLQELTAENTTTFRNCLFTGATASSTMFLADDANQIAYFYNCISFDNTGDDFDYAEKASLTYVNNCVSEDSSANDSNHTASSGNAITQTLLSTYFRDEDGDFRLLQDDFDNWGINGDSANTPALDYASTARSNDDIGPYEFVSRTYGQLLLVDEAPDVDGVIEDEAGWEDNAQAVQSPCGTFDGVNDEVIATAVAMTSAMSASFWIYTPFSTGGTQGFLCNKIDASNDFVIATNGTSVFSRFNVATVVVNAKSSSVPADNAWVHVTVTTDGIVNKIYFNAVIQGSTTPGATAHGTVELVIGNRLTNFLDGRMCDVRIYSKTLTHAEVAYIYTGGDNGTDPGLATLLAHYPLSEGSSLTAYDVSSNGNDGVSSAVDEEMWANKQDEFHWSLAKGFTVSGTVEVPALTNGTLDAQGNTITNPAGAWHNQGVTQISGIFDSVANWSYSGALSDPNFYSLDYNENAYGFSHGTGYPVLSPAEEDDEADIVSIVGASTGLQSLGNMSYSIGGRGSDTSVSLYADTTEATELGSRTKYIIQDNYLRYNATQDIVSTSGTNDGQQNLDNITYSFGRRISVKDLEDKITKENIVDNTGLYQSRFESYLEIVE